MKSEKGKVYGRPYKCRFCNQLFPRYEEWFEHQKTCKGIIPVYILKNPHLKVWDFYQE